jgi:hypothetical protein
MPQANDAQLTELYTAETNQEVENDEPNALLGQIAVNFNLRLQAVAGSAVGSSGGDYKLRINCIDETLAAPAPAAMSPGELDQEFNNNAGNDWRPAGPNFVKEQTFLIPVPANVQGHVFRYVASLVNDSGDIVSFIESNKFVLV